MLTVYRFANCRIAIYADDHFPPHFHIVGKEWRCSVTIETLELMAGSAPRSEFREAISWAARNLEFLAAKWSEFNERD